MAWAAYHGGPRGITGVVSNIGRAAPGGTAGGGSGSKTEEETVQTDYLVSKSVRELEDRMGSVQRLTVAAWVRYVEGSSGSPTPGVFRTAVTMGDDNFPVGWSVISTSVGLPVKGFAGSFAAYAYR